MSRTLSVVYYAADPLMGRRSHWSLFLSDSEASEAGTIYEAQGGLLQMTYGQRESVKPEAEVGFRGKAVLCELPEEKLARFEKIVEGTTLPSSPLKIPKGFVRRDCQDWVGDVLTELVAKEVVPADVVGKLDGIPRLIKLE